MKTRQYARQDTVRRAAVAMVAAVLLLALAGGGWADPAGAEKALRVGGSEVMDFQTIKRAAVSDPAVADYVVLSAQQIMLTGKAAGSTDFYVWDAKGQHKFRVVVTAAPSGMPGIVNQIREAIGSSAIQVSEHNGVILLEGEVDSAVEAERAEAVAGAYAARVSNLIRVRAAPERPPVDLAAVQAALGAGITVTPLADSTLLFEGEATAQQKARLDQIIRALSPRVGVVNAVSGPSREPRQVVVHVKVVDVNKSALSDIGVDWGGLAEDEDGALVAHDQPILFGEARTGPFLLDDGGPIRRLEALSARLKALATTNQARVLAEPNLLVTEGETANILVGGEIPIPVVQTTSGAATGAAGAITVEWKEFGVRLEITPTIGDDGSIDLEVSPEVSSLDFGNAIVVSNIVLPALRTRRAHTMLHMDDGQTLVIGGLYQTEWVKNVRKVPLLGDLPILGELFKHTDKQRRETELIIMVTPQIMTEIAVARQAETALAKAEETR